MPALTAEQMREVDRIMVDDLGIDLVRIMENAGRNLADLTRLLHGASSVVVLAGPGGNGGGGLVAARHLANRGVDVCVVLGQDEPDLAAAAAHQLGILRRMGVPVLREAPAHHSGVVIDALLGYSLLGAPRGRMASLITWANRHPAPVVSLETPSGLDVTTGAAATPCIQADATMTVALPKVGLLGSPQGGGPTWPTSRCHRWCTRGWS